MFPSFRRHLVAALLTLLAVPAMAEPGFPPPQTLSFDIIRHDDIIGSHTIAVTQNQGRHEITIDVKVAVTVFGIVAYRFKQHGVEYWDGGKLKSLSFETNDNGDKFNVTGEASPGYIKIAANAETFHYGMLPLTTMWRPAPLAATQILDPSDGKSYKIAVTDLGMETISVRGQLVQARHWRWDGEFKRDLWYDATGALIQGHIVGDDGSDVYLRLK
ncbi:DUF6134 family protein [Paramagnetospirillum kuznetsovii]|uniref:DUF6134 family protein n=1 Tax=Paramagnetospirillum kuznetsovii TaxID=2053833 RepID=UPI0011BD7D0D|nr:DUF6134 family protein [Paramagnetospirillum kuznetsovii]